MPKTATWKRYEKKTQKNVTGHFKIAICSQQIKRERELQQQPNEIR